MKKLLLYFILVLTLACTNKKRSEKSKTITSDIQAGKYTMIRSTSAFDGKFALTVYSNDSIVLKEGEPFRYIYFCKAVRANDGYKLIPTLAYGVNGCSKPFYAHYLDADSFPILIEPSVHDFFIGGDIEIKSKANLDTTIKITCEALGSRNIMDFKASSIGGITDTSAYTITFLPNDKNLPTVQATGGIRCLTSLESIADHRNFSLINKDNLVKIYLAYEGHNRIDTLIFKKN